MSKKNQYQVALDLKAYVNVTVAASSLEEALEKGKQIKLAEIINTNDVDVNDYEIEVSGVFK